MKAWKANYSGIRLVLWIVLIFFISWGIGYSVETGSSQWYLQLNKSQLTPPGYIFGVAWSILYLCIAIAGWKIFENNKSSQYLKLSYVAQLVLNFLWTPIFFAYQQFVIALLLLICLDMLVVLCIIIAFKQSKVVAYLLMPYLLWLLFASYLNGFILLYN